MQRAHAHCKLLGATYALHKIFSCKGGRGIWSVQGPPADYLQGREYCSWGLGGLEWSKMCSYTALMNSASPFVMCFFFFFLWVTVSIQKVLVLLLLWLEGPVVPSEHVAMLAYCEQGLALGGKWQPPSPKPFPCAGGGRASAPAGAKAMPGSPAAGGEGNTKQQGYGSSGHCSILLE